MRFPAWFLRRIWWLVPGLALSFLLWTNHARVQRIAHVTAMPQWSVEPAESDPSSRTGYAHGRRQLILLEHNNETYQWIAQTQQMLATGEWRLRHTRYDNAPAGRPVSSPSLYRWWLATLAWCDHLLFETNLAIAVERAALWADPVLHALLLVSVTIFAAARFGPFAAALASLACVGLFPFASSFVAGAADRRALTVVCSVWSVLPVVAAMHEFRRATAARATMLVRVRRWLAIGAIAGGIGLWVDASALWPILVGIAIGAVIASWITRHETPGASAPFPWRWWGLCGCATSLLAYFAEFFPHHMALRLDLNHPLFALSWLGVGELLARSDRWFSPANRDHSRAHIAATLLALTMAAAAPVAFILGAAPGELGDDPLASRLTVLKGVVMAPDLATWLSRDGFSSIAWAACLPLAILAAGIGLLLSRHSNNAVRTSLALALGAALFTLPFACAQLGLWSSLQAVLLVLLMVLAADVSNQHRPRWLLLGAGAAIIAPLGIALIWPPERGPSIALTATELQGVIERDLAQWIAQRAPRPDAVVLASPDLTTSLFFHGGLAGLGTLDPDNQSGFAAATRLASATSRDEAALLVSQRNVTSIVFTSWDAFLDHYVQLGLKAPPGSELYEKSLVAGLHRWSLPRWLRAVPYRLPTGAAFEGQSAIVFEVTDEQNAPTAISRLAEFFIESGHVELAAPLREELRRFPADLGALTALAQIEAARGDHAAFRASLDALLPYVASGAERRLPWDRRVALAIVLAQGKQIDASREQVRRCIAAMNESRLRLLTIGSLLRLLTLANAWAIEIPDEQLRERARELLPPDLRSDIARR